MAIGYGEAFASGVTSVNTPCVGVIAPAFLAFLGAMSAVARPEERRWFQAPVALGALGFAAGFTVIFVLLGASLGAASDWVRGAQDVISRVTGAVVVVFGLLATGLVPVTAGRANSLGIALHGGAYAVSLLVGVAFAIGWTPCVNEGLGRILNLSQDPATAGQGAWRLSVYSAGLMVPFVGVALLGALGAPRLLGPGWGARLVAAVAGVALMALGVLVLAGRFQELTGYLFRLTA